MLSRSVWGIQGANLDPPADGYASCLHTLRHSATGFLLATGTHTKVVQEHLSHSTSLITADTWSNVGPALARAPSVGT
jgi:integrase